MRASHVIGAERGRRRPRLTILVKLIVAFVVPTSILFALFAFVAYQMERRDLDAELGRSLENIAASAATQIRGKYLVDLRAGDEDDLRHAGALRRMQEVADATDVARLYVFDRRFRSRADTDGAPIGTRYFQAELDRRELQRVFGQGEPVSSVLFEGHDGELYKAGYAPVYASEDDREIVLALGVDAPAAFFHRLARLEKSLIIYGIVLAVAVGLIAVVMAVRITRPVRDLAEAAERIGAGDLEQRVPATSRDEIGILAETMERMRSDLRARDARMQLMLSGIAHEVRNPLGGIELFSGILRDELSGDDEKLGHLARIDRELGYLEAVVESFLDYARRPAPELGQVDLAALCRDIVELEEGEATGAGVKLAFNGGESCAAADPAQMRRVLLNLVRNAIWAAGQGDGGGEVNLRVSSEGGRARLEVDNTGEPIPGEVLPRLFEPFFTTREKGTGLGLAFASEIVADHGGTIEVDSKDGRTRFAVTLPRSAV